MNIFKYFHCERSRWYLHGYGTGLLLVFLFSFPFLLFPFPFAERNITKYDFWVLINSPGIWERLKWVLWHNTHRVLWKQNLQYEDLLFLLWFLFGLVRGQEWIISHITRMSAYSPHDSMSLWRLTNPCPFPENIFHMLDQWIN